MEGLFIKMRRDHYILNSIEIKYLWHSTIEKLPSPDEEVLGFASSPGLENLGYHVVTYDAQTDSWHEINGRRTIKNITHWLPIEPPMKIMVKRHYKGVRDREKTIDGKRHRRESDRNKDIVTRLLNGQTTSEVGELYGISHSRVSLIGTRIFRKIAPDMECSLCEMRKIKEFILKRIDEF